MERARNRQANAKKNNLALIEIKMCSKAIIIKIVWHLCRKRQIRTTKQNGKSINRSIHIRKLDMPERWYHKSIGQ